MFLVNISQVVYSNTLQVCCDLQWQYYYRCYQIQTVKSVNVWWS